MLASRPPDYPPLFPLGFHRLQIADLERACIEGFPLSTTRKLIMSNLKKFIDHLELLGARGELWLNGSFTTQKIDPEDIDIVFKYKAKYYDDPENGDFRKAVDWVNENQKKTLLCDSYSLAEYPEGHVLHEEGKWWYSYWHVKWGFSREENPKGIVVLTLSGNL